MDYSNKKELLKTIEQQNDQLTRYEKRLRGMINLFDIGCGMNCFEIDNEYISDLLMMILN